MFKKALMMVALVGGLGFVGASQAEARGFYFARRPIAPVRRVVARTVLPPYPVARAVLPPYPIARRVIYGPVVHPVPVAYGPGVYVGY